MNVTLDLAEYVFALSTAELKLGELTDISFVGSCFLISKAGLIATCAHITEKATLGKQLFVCNIKDGKFYSLENIKTHSFADFAVGTINMEQDVFLKPYPGSCFEKLGHDVMNFGYTDAFKNGTIIEYDTRISKGYISRVSDRRSEILRCNRVCELSFPSLPGCSGSPVISPHNAEVLGMLYSNLESTIETFSYSEYRDDQETVRERVSRIIDFGLMHTIEDIRVFLHDMDIKEAFS
jgi:hypothetical protein